MKLIVKCPFCGIEVIIKIPFRLRRKVDNIEWDCYCGKTVQTLYINKIKVIKLIC